MQSFKYRRVVHYSLIVCILLIQIVLAGLFYNEYLGKKNLSFIYSQLNDLQSLEKLTDNSRKELLHSHGHYQKYLESKDKKNLELFFQSVNQFTKNLDSIEILKNKNPRLKNVVTKIKSDPAQFEKLKVQIDSTQQVSAKSDFKIREKLPTLAKYDFVPSIEPYKVETVVYTDSVKKKGLFGRIGDAIKGKEAVRKDSTVVTVKHGKTITPDLMRREIDSVVNTVNNHYSREIRKIHTTVTRNDNQSNRFYQVFNSLLVNSIDLIGVYDFSIRDAKTELEKELAKINSSRSKTRENLMIGLGILLFLSTLLLMFLTKIAFVYEKKLKNANRQINENLKFKNRILGMLSHELRSPLKIIGIFINRIKKKTEDEQIKEYLKSISFTNNTLLMQANQILEYTKNQQVENKLNPVVFNLKNEIDSILNSVEPYIETRNNSFIVKENIDPNIEVFTDNNKINQLFMNILGNANKFTENGQITVTTNTEKIADKIVKLSTEIKDSGVGISKSDLEKIFEPYYQGVLSDKVENLGAGLGLSLCKELVALYDGNISVSSEPQVGTTVFFTLNLQVNDEQPR